MNINTATENIDYYYSLAHTYLNKCDKSDLEQIPAKIENHSVAVLLDHTIVPTPAIQIQLALFTKENSPAIGTYTLYIDSSGNFIDDFLVIG